MVPRNGGRFGGVGDARSGANPELRMPYTPVTDREAEVGKKDVISGCAFPRPRSHARNRWLYRLLKCSRLKFVARRIPLNVTFLPAARNFAMARSTFFVLPSVCTL